MNTTGYTTSPDALAALQSGDITALLEASRARFGGFRMDGTGAPDPGAGDPAGGDPTGDPAGDPNPDPAAGDPAGDPDPTEDARVKRANAQAAALRVELRETKAALEQQGQTLAALAAVFNPGADPAADPAQLAATATAEAEALRAEVAAAKAELLVHSIAGENGGNPVALLDSRTFEATLRGLDPTAADYTDQVATAIKDAVSKNASLSAAPGQAPVRGGASGAGQGPAEPAGAVTQEQFNAMGVAQRNELFRTNPDLYRRLAANIR